MAHHHPTPSIGLRPPPASFTSGDAGHGHGGAGGPTSSSRSSSGGSSSSGGQPPFLKVFEAHSARLTDDYLWFMEGRSVAPSLLLHRLCSPSLVPRTLTLSTRPFGDGLAFLVRARVRLEMQ